MQLSGLLPTVVLGLALALLGSPPAPGGAGEPHPVGVWPLEPVPPVVAGFDPPESPYGPGHRGVDLLGRPGQPVRTALPGRVRFSGRVGGLPLVVVGHGERRTTYQPVVGLREVDDRVAAGEVVGVLDPRGSHCFPASCLHWGWRDDTTYYDPLLLVGLGPVRLLPLWREVPVRRAGAPADRPDATGRW